MQAIFIRLCRSLRRSIHFSTGHSKGFSAGFSAGGVASLLLCSFLIPCIAVGQGTSAEDFDTAVEVAIRPLAEYTPFGPTGSERIPFWKKHLPVSEPTHVFHLDLSSPVMQYGSLLWFEFEGDAVPGVHYSVGETSPMRLLPGQTSAAIPVRLIDTGEFFLEKRLVLRLIKGDKVKVHPLSRRAELMLRPAAKPPTLVIPTTYFEVPQSSVAHVPMLLSEPSQEPVSFHYRIQAGQTLTDFNFIDSGTVVFAPGQTQVNVPFVVGPAAQIGESIRFELEHERKEVRYVVPPMDSNLTSNPHLYPQEIHIDENMWTHSVGGIQSFEHGDLRNAPEEGWALPGNPSDNLTGGSYWEPGKEDQMLVDLLDQVDLNPVLDPFSGQRLKMYTIADAASTYAPYLRKSFNGSFCGANTQLYTLPEYTRISYYIALPQGADAARAVPFFRAGIRLRSLNMNHGVTFRVGSTGVDRFGQSVPVWQTSLGPIGVWDLKNIEPTLDRYGIVEDAHGVRVWYAHKLDPNHDWSNGVGQPIFEVPGVAFGNPIEYPTWVSTSDGSLASMGLNDIDDATGMGNMPYGFFWEISNDIETFEGPLRPYFEKPGHWWEPRGNVAIDQATSLFFSVR